MKINKITSKNFRGTGEQEQILSGKNMIITGANKSGKTRLIDRILWCLYGKDLAETSDKEIIDINNPTQNVSVEIEFVTDNGEIHTIEKTIKPTGTKTYKINNMPIKGQAQYLGFIEQHFGTEKEVFSYMVPYKIFSSYTIQDLRNFILNLTPNVSAQEIYKQDKSLESLSSRFAIHNPEQIIAIEKEALKNIKPDKTRIQAQIEVSQQNAAQVMIDKADYSLSDYENKIKTLDMQLRKLDPSNTNNEYEQEIQKLEIAKQKIDNLEKEWLMRKQARLTEVKTQLRSAESELNSSERTYKDNQLLAQDLIEEIKEMDLKLQALRDKLKNIDENFNCPICQSKVTDNDLLEKYKNEIKQEGMSLKQKRDKLSYRAEQIANMIMEHFENKPILEEKIQKLSDYNIDNDKEYIARPLNLVDAERELSIIQNKILELAEFEQENQGTEVNLELLETEKKYWEEQKQNFVIHSQYIQTINQNRETLKSLTDKEQESEEWLNKAKSFINLQAQMKEESLSKLFDGEITWQLFREKIDGEQEPICKALDKNGASHDRWSTGQRISLGILLIDKISAIKGLKPILLVDDSGLLDTTPKSEQELQMIVAKTSEYGTELTIDFE